MRCATLTPGRARGNLISPFPFGIVSRKPRGVGPRGFLAFYRFGGCGLRGSALRTVHVQTRPAGRQVGHAMVITSPRGLRSTGWAPGEAGTQPGGQSSPASSASALRDYRDFIQYVQSTQGHLNSGEGLCFSQRHYPSPR